VPEFKNAIVSHGEESPDQLLAHPDNWRIHSQIQQETLEKVMDEVGWVDEVIVNQRTGRVVNGHCRVAIALRRGEQSVPVRYINVDEEREKLILRTFDTITELADFDAVKFQRLHEELRAMPSMADLGPTLDELWQLSPLAMEKKRSSNIGEHQDGDGGEGSEHVAPAAVRVFTLFLDDAKLAEFRTLVERLAGEFGTDNPTDTVMEALRRCGGDD